MRRNPANRTFDWKGAIPMLLLAVVLAITIGGIVISWHVSVRETAYRQVVDLEQDTKGLYDELARQFAVLDGYAASFTQEQLRVHSMLLEKLKRCAYNTEFSYVCFAYPDGTLYRNDDVAVQVDHRNYFQRAIGGSRVVEFLENSTIDPTPRVGMAIPVTINGRIEGVLLGLYSRSGFQTLFQGATFSRDSLTYICDSTGQLILGTQAAEQFLNENGLHITQDSSLVNIIDKARFSLGSKEQLLEDLAAGRSGQVAYDYAGAHRYTAYVPLGVNDWYILSVLHEKQIFQSAIGITGMFYGLILFTMLAAMFIIIHLMVRERKRARLEKARLERDDLTGLLTEKAFLDRVTNWQKSMRTGEFCLVYLDIYKFKLVNEIYGYDRGNALLQALAKDLAAFTGTCGGLCARITGDRFVMLIPHREELIQSFYDKEQEYRDKRVIQLDFYIHYGICVIEDLSVPADRLVDAARLAQQMVKGNYENRVCYYDSGVKDKLLKEQEIISTMAQALDNREFIIHLQPQYNHRSGAICGAEALVRWNSPEKGLIPPGEFIPVFESNGFISLLDEYVWETVCALQRDWQEQGHDILPISINVSRADMLKGGIADKLFALIRKYGLTPDKLRVEITESAYMDNPQQLIAEIHRLTERGFTVEMDDFGSGYSSLNMLKDVPFHVLKTDLKFLSAGGSETRKDRILDNIIRMAHEMGMFVVAEGVETQEQADYLLTLNCEQMQGYYFSRPIPVSQYEQMVYTNG